MSNQDNAFNKMKQNYPQHSIIFSEGEIGRNMYVILDGEVEIRKKTGKNSHKVLVSLKAGDFFGEMAIIENKPRTATAVAKVTSSLIALDTDAFYTMVEKSSDFAVKMIKTLSSRLRKADLLIEYILGSNDEKQVVSGIAAYVKSHPETDTGSGECKIILREYLRWSSQNLGHPDDMVLQTIKRLIVRKIVKIYDPPERITEFYMDRKLLVRLL
jgi:CRP/FNR family transcriptional regulator, cyclic AMP receptor protein